MGTIDLDQIAEICADYSGPDYYVEDLIPGAKLSKARESFPIPVREHVIAFVNTTVFGSGKNGMAICASGIYWHNDWTTATSKNFLDWESFIEVNIRRKGMYDIELGPDNLLNMSGCSFKKDVLVQLLQKLQSYVIEALEGEGEHRDDKVSVPPIPVPASEWMVAIAGQQYGPYDLSLLKSMVETKQIRPEETHVWKSGMPAWVSFMQQPETAALAVPAMPAAPPVPVVPPAVPSFADPIAEALDEAAAAADDSGPVDVNTAPWESLIDLPGVGAVAAKRIVQQREAVGGFESPEQIGELLGLKPHQVEKLRRHTVFTPLPGKLKSARMVDF